MENQSTPRVLLKRMTIQLNPELAKGLEWLAEELGITQVEALRRAIGTEIYLRRELRDGAKLVCKKGSKIKEIVLLR